MGERVRTRIEEGLGVVLMEGNMAEDGVGMRRERAEYGAECREKRGGERKREE